MLGVDALGIGLGAGFGGFGGAIDGNFAGDAVSLFADLKEQSMAQARTCRLSPVLELGLIPGRKVRVHGYAVVEPCLGPAG